MHVYYSQKGSCCIWEVQVDTVHCLINRRLSQGTEWLCFDVWVKICKDPISGSSKRSQHSPYVHFYTRYITHLNNKLRLSLTPATDLILCLHTMTLERELFSAAELWCDLILCASPLCTCVDAEAAALRRPSDKLSALIHLLDFVRLIPCSDVTRVLSRSLLNRRSLHKILLSLELPLNFSSVPQRWACCLKI